MRKMLKHSGTLIILAALIFSACGGGGSSGQKNTLAVPAITGVTPAVHSVTVTWNAVSEATSYNLYYKQDTTVSTTSGTKLEVTGGATQAVVTGLKGLRTYAFIVTAGNSDGESAASSVESAVPEAEWGTATLIEDNSGNTGPPQVAFDGSGNAIAVWSQHDGAYYNIYANRYAAGSGWGTAVLIETNAGNADNPQIAFDASGNAIAVWERNDMPANICANRYTAGSGWGTGVLLINTVDGAASAPQIAFDASGNAIAVWQQYAGTTQSIYTNRYTAGSGWGTAALIETDNAGDAYDPQIAFDGSGNAIAVWSQDDGTSTNICANRYAAGSGWGTAILIETNAENAHIPQIAFDGSGNAVAVWIQYDGSYDSIYANRYTAGSGWGTAALIETNAGDAYNPQIALDGSGNAIAVWSQYDGADWDNVCANRYTAGSGWGTAVVIETYNEGSAYAPHIKFDANGNAIAVWCQDYGTSTDIWANRYTTGSGWGTAALIETNAETAGDPQIAIDTNGNSIAVWYQYDGTRKNIWANRYE
jgi:hypothetical protein